MSLQIDFGIAIQRLRKQRGLSQERLALEADIDRRYMSDVENGKRNISLDIMERIARQLGIEVSELIRHAEKVSKMPLTIDIIVNYANGARDFEKLKSKQEISNMIDK